MRTCRGILHGKHKSRWENHRTADGAPPLPPRVRNKLRWSETPERSIRGRVFWEETFKEPGEADRSYRRALFLAISSQGPDTHSRLLLGKRNWLKSGLPYPHCPRQLGPPLPSPRNKGVPHWALGRLTCRDQNQCAWNCRTDRLEGPASGNRLHQGSSLHSPRSASGHW